MYLESYENISLTIIDLIFDDKSIFSIVEFLFLLRTINVILFKFKFKISEFINDLLWEIFVWRESRSAVYSSTFMPFPHILKIKEDMSGFLGTVIDYPLSYFWRIWFVYYFINLILRWIHCIIEARLIISAMYFEEENIEDKGLFTFYREQGEKEDQLRRNKKLRK